MKEYKFTIDPNTWEGRRSFRTWLKQRRCKDHEFEDAGWFSDGVADLIKCPMEKCKKCGYKRLIYSKRRY